MLRYIRPERVFDSLDSLGDQIAADAQTAKEIFNSIENNNRSRPRVNPQAVFVYLNVTVGTNIITCKIRTDLLVHSPAPKIQYGKRLRGMI